MIDLGTCNKDIALAYIAGFMDGDGCICLNMMWGTNNRPYFRVDIVFSNTRKDVLVSIDQFLNTHFGIASTCTAGKKRKSKHKTLWNMALTGAANKQSLCIALLPYLFLKTKQAQLVIDYYNIAGAEDYLRCTDSQFTHQLVIWKEMQLLNKRGLDI